MKRLINILYCVVLTIALITVAMLAFADTAMAEEPQVNLYDQFIPLGESSISDYGPLNDDWAAFTEYGTVYRLYTKHGAEFLFTVTLPKMIPFIEPGSTEIALVNTPHKEDPSEVIDDWVNIEEVNITEDDFVKIVFYIATPSGIPSGHYEFWAFTEGLEQPIGTTILEIEVEEVDEDTTAIAS